MSTDINWNVLKNLDIDEDDSVACLNVDHKKQIDKIGNFARFFNWSRCISEFKYCPYCGNKINLDK